MSSPALKSTYQNKLSGMNILFVSHAFITIFSDLFRDYTSIRSRTYSIFRHPLFPVKGSQSKLFVYKKKKKVKQAQMSRILGPFIVNFIKDFFLTIFWGMRDGKVYDIAFGTNNLNTLSLLVLRKFRRVKRVIFMNIDYTPSRYDNPILDSMYHWFDRICCYNADIIWNSSERTNQARIRNGVDPKRIVKTIVMPDGSNFDSSKRLSIEKIDKKKLVFIGGMRPVMGVELILKSFKDVLKKIPDAKLLLIGGGPYLEQYKKLSQLLHIGPSVNFTGFIESHDEVDNLMCTGAIGLAPFVPDKSSYEFYSDVGKPKAYLAAGMPVIITRVPAIAEEIENEHAGFVIDYDKKQLTDTVIMILGDRRKYKEFRANAIRMSKKYLWDNIFEDAYNKTLTFFELK